MAGAIVAVGSFALLDSCGGGTEDGEDETEKTVEEKVVETRPSLVNVYIDASGSMRDYFGKVDLENMSEALTKISQVPEDFNVKYYVWSVPPKEINRDELTKKLINKALNGQSTVFSKIFGPMVEESGSDTLAVLISDGLISSSMAETKLSDNYTELDLGHLTTDIQKVLHKSGRAISIYRMEGDFDGYYYNKTNAKVRYKGERPFFVFVMGKPATVRYFDSEARQGNLGEEYKDAESLHFGTAPKNMQFRLEPTEGSDNMADFDAFDRKDGTSDYIYTGLQGFRVAAKLPEWIRENYKNTTIRQMSHISINGTECPNFKVNVDDGRVVFDIPQSMVDKFNSNSEKYTITYTLTDPSAGAWDKYSTSDDTVPEEDTTYLLSDLILAIRKGIVGNETELLSSSITIIPND